MCSSSLLLTRVGIGHQRVRHRAEGYEHVRPRAREPRRVDSVTVRQSFDRGARKLICDRCCNLIHGAQHWPHWCAANPIMFNTQFLVFNTKFLVFNAQFLVPNTKPLVLNTKFISFTHPSALIIARSAGVLQ